MKSGSATPDLRRLDVFLGAWNTTGEVKASPSESPVKFQARDTYEWLPGGFFLLHRFDAKMPEGDIQGIEIIGFDVASGTFPMYSFDSQGNTVVMRARVTGKRWTFSGDGVRFIGEFHDDGNTLTGEWETKAEGGSAWQPWMRVTLKRAK